MKIKDTFTIDSPLQIWFVLSDGKEEYHLKAAITEFKKLPCSEKPRLDQTTEMSISLKKRTFSPGK